MGDASLDYSNLSYGERLPILALSQANRPENFYFPLRGEVFPQSRGKDNKRYVVPVLHWGAGQG